MSPTISGFVDLVQLADHPGDMLTYRHFRMTPLAGVMYPEGVPDSLEISMKMADEFATKGLVAVFKEIRDTMVGGDVSAPRCLDETFETEYQSLLLAADEFAKNLKVDSRLADFAKQWADGYDVGVHGVTALPGDDGVHGVTALPGDDGVHGVPALPCDSSEGGRARSPSAPQCHD